VAANLLRHGRPNGPGVNCHCQSESIGAIRDAISHGPYQSHSSGDLLRHRGIWRVGERNLRGSERERGPIATAHKAGE
jgi:hypothetical protein